MKIDRIDKSLVEQYKLNCNSRQINNFFLPDKKKDTIQKGLPARLNDLVRIIMYFNFVDRLNVCDNKEVPTIEIPVYDPIFWNGEKEQLQKMLWSLYRRDFILDFIMEESSKPKTQIQKKLFEDHREILLFSEGLDSIAAATEYKEAILVHVVKAPYIESHMEKIKKDLFPDRHIEKISYGLRGEKLPPDTGISNSRGLIFLGLASIHLQLQKSNTLISGENGLMMHNPPLFEGSKPTRTMNPDFVRSMQELLTSIYGRDISIKTPYVNKTKTEVLEIAKRNLKEKFDTAVVSSYSCFSQQPRGKEKKMCGRCYACLLRTISLRALQGYDNSAYDQSPFSEDFKDGRGIVNVMDLIRFSRGVLQNKLPYAAKKIVGKDEDLFRRFAKEVITTVRQVPERSEELRIEARRHF